MNKSVDQYNEKIETNPKAPKFKDMIESELLTTRIFLVTFTLKIGQQKYCWLLVKNNSWRNKIKDLNWEKIIGVFMKKNCCWVNYKWVIIQNQTVILEIKSK